MKSIRIKDYYGNYQCVHVDDQFFDEWCKMRNEDHNQRRRVNYHCLNFEAAILESLHNNLCEDPVFEEYARTEENIKLYEPHKSECRNSYPYKYFEHRYTQNLFPKISTF